MAARGWRPSIIIADYHAVLSHGLDWVDVTNRANYYQAYLSHCCGIPGDILFGSKFQSDPEYFELLLRASSQTSLASVKAALPSRPPRRVEGLWPDLGAALYQVMQCVDAAYFGVDFIVADAGQRKTYALMSSFPAVSAISHHGWRRNSPRDPKSPRPRLLCLPTGVDIRGQPLRESQAATRISIHETLETLESKVQKMYAPPSGQASQPGVENALLWHFENSVFPWRDEPLEIEGGGRKRAFATYRDFEGDYLAGRLHPMDCKVALAEALWQRIGRVQGLLANVLVDWVKP